MSDASRIAAIAPLDMHPARWCAEHVFIQNSERGERFDPDQLRWWIKPMGCYADMETRIIVCVMPTGAGKSTFFEAINCWIPAQSPGSTLYATLSDSNAKEWMKTRMRPTLEKCKPLDHLWPSNLRNNATDELILWKNCFLTGGGHGISNLQEKSITYGEADECWDWTDGHIKEWLARGHNRENRKFCMVSQAGIASKSDDEGFTCEFHLEHDKCRKWDFGWRCQKCGHAHVYSFDQLKWETVSKPDGTEDDQASADTVHRVCPNEECGERYPDTPAVRRMLHDSLKENDGYIITSDNGRRGYEGFHLDRGAIWWCSWSDDVLKKMAADKRMAKGDHTGLMEWTMKDRALSWSMMESSKTIELKTSGFTHADFEDARKIDGEKMRFCTIDAGGDHFWLLIQAWAEGGASKILHFSYEPTEEACEQRRIEYGVMPELTFLDVGFDQERMAGIITRYGWQGIKGDGNRKSGWEWEIKSGPKKGQKETRLYSKLWHAKAKDGKRARCWHVATTPLQYILQRLIDGEGAEWLVYDNAPPSFAKHLNGEYLAVKKDARGREVQEWTRRGANHGRDTALYSLAAALMFRVFAPIAIEE